MKKKLKRNNVNIFYLTLWPTVKSNLNTALISLGTSCEKRTARCSGEYFDLNTGTLYNKHIEYSRTL